MKERIVINQDWMVKDMKAGVPELDKLFICQKVEQVPESWEELLELCKKTGHYAINIIRGGFLDREYIFIFGLTFKQNGDIEDIENDNIVEKRTPEQMWEIIKNLIGGEK